MLAGRIRRVCRRSLSPGRVGAFLRCGRGVDVDDERRIRSWFQAHGGRFGLSGSPVSCRAVLNLGGFTNRSFTIEDGRRRLHLKLADEANAPGLRRWMRVHGDLEVAYRAPRLLGALEGAGIAGEALALVFEHVPGRPLNPLHERGALQDALVLAARLHHDVALGDRLGPPSRAGGRACADDLIETYAERLRADLAVVEPAVAELEFVSADFPAWARSEIDALEAAVQADPAFAVPATAVVHGDLHVGNLLLGLDGGWWVLDWDDLHAGGDGALDATNLLRPLLLRGLGADLLTEYARAAECPGVEDRAILYRRAMLLDEIIDSLADYVEADAMPAHRKAVRAIKAAAHLEALPIYRRAFGG